MKSTYSVTQAQSNLPKLVRESAKGARPVAITVHNETQAFLVSRERMEALAETLEILGNDNAMSAIRSYEAGKMEFTDFDFDQD